ncbi:hypothetical protein [Burkholderia anthina]|uniref:hypothetical protein n=1 Tax=Burkholderia anthina TaxID=179879 RepID=UPI001AA0ADD5|nr:hypothetical protein [Burkholderia anthina]QTD94189.1 hypothetical protein J4G50_25575 [Burkholderia anthina]
MFKKLTTVLPSLRQSERTTATPTADRAPPKVVGQKTSLNVQPSIPLVGLQKQKPAPALRLPEATEPETDWSKDVHAALDAVMQPGVTPVTSSGGSRRAGFTVQKQPSTRSNAPLDPAKPKSRPMSRPPSIVDLARKDDTSGTSHVPPVVATTLHETETAPTTRTTEVVATTDAAETDPHAEHTARLARVFDEFFGEAETPPVTSAQSSTEAPAGKSSAKDKYAPLVANVPPEKIAEQLAAVHASNKDFRAMLANRDMEPIPNGGKGNNCSIYSLVQCAAPDLDDAALHQVVGEIRAEFDAAHTGEAGQMLLLDANEGGHGKALVSLVNKRFGVDMQVGVVQAGVSPEHPVTTLGQFHGERPSGQARALRVVVWDQHRHFEAVTSTAGQAVVTAEPKLATSTTGKGTEVSPARKSSTPPHVTTTHSTTAESTSPVTATVTKQASGGLGTSKSEGKVKGKSDDEPPGKSHDGTSPASTKTTTEAATARPHGIALTKLVPNPSSGAKIFRKLGRWMRVDNENAVPQLLNRTKPEGGIVQGLSKAHMTTTAPSALQLAHESVNAVYAAQELGSSAMRKSRYQAMLKQWPAADDEPKVKTGGSEVPLSEIARRKDFQSRYDLKVAILGQPEGAEREQMLDVLTGRYIAEVQGKNRVVRSAIKTTMSVVGVGAGVGLAVGTHGVAPAALAGGAILSGRDLLDNRKAAHSLKQHYRDKKMDAIDHGARQHRLKNKYTGEPGDEEKAGWDSVRKDVSQQRIKRFLPIKYDMFNENKSTGEKKQEVDLVKKHAAARVAGAVEESHGRHSLQDAYMKSSGVNKKALKQFYRDAVDADRREDGGSDIAAALQLMRDLGMSKMEAISHLRTAAAGNLTRPKIDDEDEKKRLKEHPDAIVRAMMQSPSDHLESAIGSAMGRR